MSIITVCLNCDKIIEKTIQSVVEQTYSNIEYIIIDGGSTDGTCAIIEKYKKNLAFFSSNPDGGIYDAMNNGLNNANGDLIYFLNAGDYLFNQSTIQQVINAYNLIKSDILYGDIYLFDNDSSFLLKQNNKNFLKIVSGYGINHQSLFAKKTLFNAKNGFNINYKIYSDYDWLLNCIFNKNANMQYLNFPIAYYQKGGRSQKTPNKYFNERIKIILKYSKKIFLPKLIVRNLKDFFYLVFIIVFLTISSFIPEKIYSKIIDGFSVKYL